MRVSLSLKTRQMLYKTWLLVSLLILGNVLLLCFTLITLERRKVWKPPKKTSAHYPQYYRVAYPQKYGFIIDQPKKCEESRPFVVIIVPVAPQNTEARDAIRKTWGSEALVQKKSVLVLFLLGSRRGTDNDTLQERLRKESEQYQDLLQSNFQDSYRNLTVKTMVMMEWLSRRCPRASYAVKVDADVLLNIRNLMYMLVTLKTQRNYITGLVLTGNSVLRDPSSKFYLPHSVYPRSRYPPYPVGMCYIFSMDLPEKIVRVSTRIKPIFIEDAYLGMCLRHLGIAPKKPPNMRLFVVRPPQRYDRCFYSKLIAILTSNTTQLISYWTDIHSSATPC